MRTTPDFSGLRPASARSSAAARGVSRKRDTQPELVLRRACFAAGLRYRVDVSSLPGRPDLLFVAARLVVFVDGDLWHGLDLHDRLRRLAAGHNADYWGRKMQHNVERDRINDAALSRLGWSVMRFWATDVEENVDAYVDVVRSSVHKLR